MNITSASQTFAEHLLQVFLSWELITDLKSIKCQSENTIYRIWVRGKTSLQKLSTIIYTHATADDFLIHKRVFMSQFNKKPYLSADFNNPARWIIVNSKIVQTPISNRISFRTNISKTILDDLSLMAHEYKCKVNYLLEIGLQHLLDNKEHLNFRIYKARDRIQYKSTYDKDLLVNIRMLAIEKELRLNELIEMSVQFIDIKKIRGDSC
jgi:hypothetical protein